MFTHSQIGGVDVFQLYNVGLYCALLRTSNNFWHTYSKNTYPGRCNFRETRSGLVQFIFTNSQVRSASPPKSDFPYSVYHIQNASLLRLGHSSCTIYFYCPDPVQPGSINSLSSKGTSLHQRSERGDPSQVIVLKQADSTSCQWVNMHSFFPAVLSFL